MVTPWFEAVINENQIPTPKLIKYDSENRADEILKLKPDIVIAINSDLKKEEYRALSKHVPTIGPLDDSQNVSLERATEIICGVIGRPNSAKLLISKTKAKISRIRKDYEFDSKFRYAIITHDESSYIGAQLYTLNSNATRNLKLMGFEPTGLPELDPGESGKPQLYSYADYQGIMADIFLVFTKDSIWGEKDKKTGEIEPGLSDLLKRNPYSLVQVRFSDYEFALRDSSPLSIIWASHFLVQQIARATYILKHPK